MRWAINARLPLGQQLPTGYRLYAAPCDQQPDVTVAASVTAEQFFDSFRQALLQWRRRAELPTTWRDDPAVASWWRCANPFAPEPEHPDADSGTVEVDRLRREVEEVRRSLSIEQRARIEAERRHAVDLAELEKLRVELAALVHGAGLAAENAMLHQLNARQAAALTEVEAELHGALRRTTHLLTHMPQTPASPAAVQDDDVPQFPTFVDLLAAAKIAFPNLVVTADPAPAAALDEHEKAELCRQSWGDGRSRTITRYCGLRDSPLRTGPSRTLSVL